MEVRAEKVREVGAAGHNNDEEAKFAASATDVSGLTHRSPAGPRVLRV